MKAETSHNWSLLKRWLPESQRSAILECLRGEEAEGFEQLVNLLGDRLATMPKTYEQDGKGDDAIAYVHFFRGDMDWFITEGDITPDGNGVHRQAFGWCDLGWGCPELGYVDIQELRDNGIEFDLYWQPKTLREIKAR